MKTKTIRDIEIKNKMVLLRTDYNVPLVKYGREWRVADGTRIELSMPTINFILKKGAGKLIIISHLGRPLGAYNKEFSLKPVARYLEKRLGEKVEFVTDYLEKAGAVQIKEARARIVVLENLRFFKGEEANEPEFARKLARLGEIFVNDAFGSCHRVHASIVGITRFLPEAAGLLLKKEIETIDRVMKSAKHPFVAVVGGAKAKSKIPLIEKLMTKADYLLLGGGVANTFLKAVGHEIGRSVYEKESVQLAGYLVEQAARVETRLYLPRDVRAVNDGRTGKVIGIPIEQISKEEKILDIGKETGKEYALIISKARNLIWNGPMGMTERREFRNGTEAVYGAIVKNKHLTSIIGGGETLASIKDLNSHNKNLHFSTGGGAMLEYIEEGSLPGIEALKYMKT